MIHSMVLQLAVATSILGYKKPTSTIRKNLQSWIKIVGTPYAIYYNYLYIYHKNRKWGMTLIKKKAEVLAFIIILPRPHLSRQCWESGSDWQHDSDQHWIGGTGVTLLLNQVKCVNIFSMAVDESNGHAMMVQNRAKCSQMSLSKTVTRSSMNTTKIDCQRYASILTHDLRLSIFFS